MTTTTTIFAVIMAVPVLAALAQRLADESAGPVRS